MAEQDGVSRRQLIGYGAAAAGGLVVGTAFPREGWAAPADVAGTTDFSVVFDRVVHSSGSRLTLTVGYLTIADDASLVLDELARRAPDGGLATRADGIRYGDYVFATGRRAEDGSLLASAVWSGVLSFPATVLEVSASEVVLAVRGAAKLTAPRSKATAYAEEFQAPSPGVPDTAAGREAIAVGILRDGYDTVDLASLTALETPWEAGWVIR